MFNQMVTKHY